MEYIKRKIVGYWGTFEELRQGRRWSQPWKKPDWHEDRNRLAIWKKSNVKIHRYDRHDPAQVEKNDSTQKVFLNYK